jgi:hypothetical protein
MTEQTAPKKPRAPKAEGPKAHVLTVEGKTFLVMLDAIRVANGADLTAALYGDKLPRGIVVDAKDGQP